MSMNDECLTLVLQTKIGTIELCKPYTIIMTSSVIILSSLSAQKLFHDQYNIIVTAVC